MLTTLVVHYVYGDKQFLYIDKQFFAMIVQMVKNLGTLMPLISRSSRLPLLRMGQRHFCSYTEVQERIRKLSLMRDAIQQPQMLAEMEKLQKMADKQAETGDISKAYNMLVWKCDQTMTLAGYTSDKAMQQVISFGKWAAAHYKLQQAYIIFANAKLMQSKKSYRNELDKQRETKQIEALLQEIKYKQEKGKEELEQKIRNKSAKLNAINEALGKFQAAADQATYSIRKAKHYKQITDQNIRTVSEQWHIQPILTYCTLVNLQMATEWDIQATLQSVLAYLQSHPQLDERSCYRGICLFQLMRRNILINNSQKALQHGVQAVQQLAKQKYLNPQTQHMTVNVFADMVFIYNYLDPKNSNKKIYESAFSQQVSRRLKLGTIDRVVADYLAHIGQRYHNQNKREKAHQSYVYARSIYEQLYPKPHERDMEIQTIINFLSKFVKETEK